MGAAIIVVCTIASTAVAMPGQLDSSFGNAGVAVTALGSAAAGRAVAIQADSKIVVAGVAGEPGKLDFAVVRYDSNGALDPSFGNAGTVVSDIGSYNDYGASVAIQTDGRIVVAGSTADESGSRRKIAVVRYNADGTPDGNFGSAGKVITSLGAVIDEAYSVAIQGDGKIVVAGISTAERRSDFAVVRYGADGKLDPSFGTGGSVTTLLGSSGSKASALRIQPDGKIVVAGSSCSGSACEFALVRYAVNGDLDESFGNGGRATSAVGSSSYDVGLDVVLQSDGKILVAGSASNGSDDDFALARFDAHGNLDPQFGVHGKITTAIGLARDNAASVALQRDGKIVVAGFSDNGSDDDLAVARYNSNGTLDDSFGNGGKVTTGLGDAFSEAGLSVAIEGSGKIVAAGVSHKGSNDSYLAVRFQAE